MSHQFRHPTQQISILYSVITVSLSLRSLSLSISHCIRLSFSYIATTVYNGTNLYFLFRLPFTCVAVTGRAPWTLHSESISRNLPHLESLSRKEGASSVFSCSCMHRSTWAQGEALNGLPEISKKRKEKPQARARVVIAKVQVSPETTCSLSTRCDDSLQPSLAKATFGVKHT